MRTLLLALLLTLNCLEPPKSKSHLTIKYDRFKDHTVVTIWEMPLGSAVSSPQIDLSATYIFQGHLPKSPEDGGPLVVTISSKYLPILLEPPEIYLLVDRRRLSLKSERLLDIYGNGEGKHAKIPVTIELFRQLAGAKLVEGRLGDTEFHLTSQNKKEMRDFLKAITSPKLN